MRKYGKSSIELDSFVTSVTGVSIYCVAVDPSSSKVAVSSEYVLFCYVRINIDVIYREPVVKIVDLQDPLKVTLLKGHTKAVRRVTWHPSGTLLVRESPCYECHNSRFYWF